MAHDDRDRYLEKALGRHFRPSAQGSQPAPASGSGNACPDAEVLAAYHDGSLSLEERTFWKQHVLSCADCQVVLTHLATPLEVAVAAGVAEPIGAAAASTQHSLRPQAVAATPARTASVSIARPRKTYFRWLVPAGAIAAGLLTFVVIRETQNGAKPENTRVETADNRAVQPPPSPVSPPEGQVAESRKTPAAEPTGGAERLKDQKEKAETKAVSRERDQEKPQSPAAPAVVGGVVSGAAGQPAAAAQGVPQQNQLVQQNANAHGERSSNGPEIGAQQQQRQQAMRAAGAAARPSEPPPPPPESAFLADADLAQRPAQKAPPAAAAPKPQPPTTSADAVSATAETVESYSPSALAKVRTAAAQNPQTFGAPGGKVLWRVGPAGSIEQSSDAGATWTPQTSGVTVDLRSGAAPTPQLCWVVGRSGTILRTVDGGEHWVKIGPPVLADLAAVRATDAFHASIWYVGDQRTGVLQGYQTSDGGVNWSAIPSN